MRSIEEGEFLDLSCFLSYSGSSWKETPRTIRPEGDIDDGTDHPR